MTINALRLSFIATETLLDPQRGGAPGAALAAFVSRPGYIALIDSLQQGEAAPLGLRLPWPRPVGQHFWDFYLSQKTPGDAPGKLCFQKLVPLRLPKLAEEIAVAEPSVGAPATLRAALEGFYFPHGTGLVLTLDVAGAFAHPDAGANAMSLRYDRLYQVTWPGAPTGALTLNQVVTAALDRLRALGFGAGISGSRSEFFSIATVIRGEGVDPDQPLADDGPDHRLLNGLAGWVRAWSQLKAPPLVAHVTQLATKQSTAWPGNVLFAAKRGRAVWFPGQFRPTQPSLHGLGCYHRNLVLGSLQVESLLGLAAATEYEFRQAAAVPNGIQRFAQLAAGLLARLCTGANSYRSASLQAQIAQSPQLADVNALRARYRMQPPLP